MPRNSLLASIGDPTSRITSSNITKRIKAVEEFWSNNPQNPKRLCFWNKFIEAKNNYERNKTEANKKTFHKLLCDNKLNDEFFGGDPSYKNCPAEFKGQKTNLCNSTTRSRSRSRSGSRTGSRGRRTGSRGRRS